MTAAVDSDSVQQKFDAAVRIIHSLPREGPFQQSNDTKLQFYGLYKQATVGKCNTPKPGFWDVVNKAKWESWKCLGDLSEDQAKLKYISLLAQIVETMTLDDSVQEFVELIGPVYNFVQKETSNGAIKMGNGNIAKGGPGHADANHSDDSGVQDNRVHVDDNGAISGIVTTNGIENGSLSNLSEFASEDENFADAPESKDEPFVNVNDEIAEEVDDIRDNAHPSAVVDSSVSGDEREPRSTVHKSVQWKRSSSREDEGSAIVGKLLRDVPEFDNTTPVNYEQLLSDAWEAAERAQLDRQRRLNNNSEDDSFLFPSRPRRRKSHGKRTRGRGEQTAAPNASGQQNTQPSYGQSTSQQVEHEAGSTSSVVIVGGEGAGSGSSESSLSRDSPEIIWDPQVGAVLYRMHKDVQQLRRQMDLVEGVLLTQQRLVTATLNNTIKAQESRLWFFENLPLRTISFILIWPFLVNFIVKICWNAFLRRRRRF